MAGKAPLLLAVVLFSVGAAGLALTSAERASWGPFQPREPQTPSRVVIVDAGSFPVEPPALTELLTPPATTLAAAEPELLTQASDPAPAAPTPTPIPPLRVFGISADDGGVSAAAATPTSPPPLRVMNVASDDGASETETPAETPTPELEPSETPAAGE